MTPAPRHIAVIDIGKTNAKLALVDAADLTETSVITRPNPVRPGPPWPHPDPEALWEFILEGLARFQASHGISAIAITTHGAAAVLLDDQGKMAVPMMDYEFEGFRQTRAAYETLRPGFAITGTPRLAGGLNLGAQLHWQLHHDPGLAGRVAQILPYPQYWLYRLTGALAADPCSLGCHSDLWDWRAGRPSDLPERLGLAGKLPPVVPPDHLFRGLRPEVAAATGLPSDLPVSCGIHDSNASLYAHLRSRAAPFTVVSTGTWVVSMAVGGRDLEIDPARDVLVNVSATGQPVPSARFMGGREYDLLLAEFAAAQGDNAAPEGDAGQSARIRVLEGDIMLMPSVQPGCGPFPDQRHSWTTAPATRAELDCAAGFYLALMTRTSLDLIGAAGPVIVEGPFSRNTAFLDMLAAISPGPVEATASATGTSVGAALLCLPGITPELASRHIDTPPNSDALQSYARRWQSRVASRSAAPG